MSLNRVVISPNYRDAASLGLTLQVPVAMICLLMLDGGLLARVCAIALLAFWIVAGLTAVRRPWSPTAGDLWYWRWGFVPCWALAFALAAWRFAA